jgi:isorenieratene synthase
MSPHPSEAAPAHRVIVIGGGVAGLVAAEALSRAGARPLVLEGEARLGGRAGVVGSIEVEAPGGVLSFPLEHGLHGVWRRYANLRRVIARIGCADRLRPAPTQELISARPDGSLLVREVGARVRESPLPSVLAFGRALAPLDLARLLLEEGPLAFARAGVDLAHALAYDAPRDAGLYAGRSVEEVVRRWPSLVRGMATAIAHTSFFVDPRDVDLEGLLTGLQAYFVLDKRDSAFDVFRDDAETDLLAPLRRAIEARGGEVRTGARAVGLEADARGVRVRLAAAGDAAGDAGGESLSGDAAVVALDPVNARALLERGPLAGHLARHAVPRGAPSLAVRLWLSRAPAAERATTGVFDRLPAHGFFWLDRLMRPFDAWRARTGGAVLEAHLYAGAARDALGRSDDEVLAGVRAIQERAWPETKGSLVRGHVVRNPARHTALGVGEMGRLPPATTPERRVGLAGDWIASPVPCLFLERSTVTGLLAARHVAPALGLRADAIEAPLAPAPAAPSIAALRLLLRALRDRGLLAGPLAASFRRHA